MVTYYQYEYDSDNLTDIFKWEHSGFHELLHQNSHVTSDHEILIAECIAALRIIYPHGEHTATTEVNVEKRQPRRVIKKIPEIWIIKTRVCDAPEGFEVEAGDFTAALTKLQTELDDEAKRIEAIKKGGQGYRNSKPFFLTMTNTENCLSSG